jgi:hypothetical protein
VSQGGRKCIYLFADREEDDVSEVVCIDGEEPEESKGDDGLFIYVLDKSPPSLSDPLPLLVQG